MKNTKRSLISSLVALLLCFSMLLGSTYAWFTDSAISGNNIIQSGNLDVEMYWSETLLASNSNAWKEADGEPIFTYDSWEPGYTDVKYIKVKNAGKLSLQWRLSIEAEGNVTDLADVINVYYIAPPVTEPVKTLTGKESAGVLSTVLDTHKSISGVLLPAGETSDIYTVGETILAIALNMQEDAGNEYIGKSIGDGFSISLIATQFNYEQDAFGKDYDKDAEWPNNVIVGGNSATVDVTPTDDDKVATAVSMQSKDGVINAQIPANVQLNADVNKLTLSVSDVANSKANISLSQTEASLSIDVHIDGVAANNEVVMAIGIKELLPVGLNMGNYRFYHVENGATVEMKLLANGATPAHNNYEYDPATGDVVLYLKSFSEVALVADNEKAWEGNFDYTWYSADKSELTIANADQLAALGTIVGGMNGQTRDSFEGKNVKLLADINLGDKNNANESLIFYPIGYYNSIGSYEKTSGVNVTSSVSSFEGTFDGNGNTIKNFYQNTWEMFGDYNDGYSGTPNHYKDAMGLFGYVYGGTVKNLTIDNFSSDGEFTPTGVVAAFAVNSTFENIAITNCNPRVYNTGNGGIIGIAGNSDDQGTLITLKNITVDKSNKISALWGSWDVACGGIVGMFRGNGDSGTGKIHFENCHVAAQIDVNNDVCANYQYYQYRYAGMLIGSVRHNIIKDGKIFPNTDGITATNCTVSFGDWNNYYYCELVANTLASYTHDYQFSRLERVQAVNGTTITYLDGTVGTVPTSGRYNYVVVDGEHATENATCYHFVDGQVWTHNQAGTETVNGETVPVENNQHIYLPFNNLFTGYGWGTNTYNLVNISEFAGVIDLTPGEHMESVEKFAEAENALTTYRPGQIITVGDLFKAIEGAKVGIVNTSVHVTVSPATENDKGSAVYTPNNNDWRSATIKLSDDCEGSIKIVITDYYYCTKTVIYLDAEQAAEKFTANTVAPQNAYTYITLEELFAKKDSATLVGSVTAILMGPDGNVIDEISGTSEDWATKQFVITKNGTYTVSIKDEDSYCAVSEVSFEVNKVDKFVKKFVNDYLYRVGNKNAVSLSALFGDASSSIAPTGLKVTIENIKGDAEGTYTDGTIKFDGTGVVKVTISADGANAVELKLEVVDAKNATTAENATENNVVLLNDVTNGSFSVGGGYAFYGNGFTITLNPDSHSTKRGAGFDGYIHMTGGTLDNVIINGPVFAAANIYRDQGQTGTGADDPVNYFRNAVIIDGGSNVISNSYISGARTAIYVKGGGDQLIENTMVSGGAYANIEVAVSASVTFRNLTTKQVETKDSYNLEKMIVGLGIVIDNAETEIYIEGVLNQYNWITQKQWDTLLGNYVNQFPKLFTDNSFQSYWHYREGDTATKYINLTMIFACSWDSSKLHDNRTDKTIEYTSANVNVAGESGGVYSTTGLGTLTDELYKAPTYKANASYPVPPKPVFDYKNKNYQATTEGSNEFCYEDGGTVKISFDAGNSKVWDTSILTVTKGNQTLAYTVKMDDTDYTGKSITFTKGGIYTVIYTYTDPYNYKLDESGNIVAYNKEYTQTVTISVTVVEAQAKNAVITLGNDGKPVEKFTINDKTYLSATGVDASGWTNSGTIKFPKYDGDTSTTSFKYDSNKTWGSASINGQTFYFPIVAMGTTDGKFSHTGSWYGCFPVFDGTMTITDYADGGTAETPTVYDSSTTTMPTNLQALYPQTVFRYQGTQSKVPTTPSKITKGTYNGKLCYTTQTDLSASNERAEEWNLATYTYTDNKGATYYWYVGYYCAASTNGGCVTGDTLVTLANGTQARVDSLTGEEELLVWNHTTGKLENVPVAYIVDHNGVVSEREIIRLTFSNGKTVKIIGEHVFFDATLNKYVAIDTENADSFIGHTFAALSSDGTTLEKVELVSVERETCETAVYEVVSYKNLTCFTDGILSASAFLDPLLNVFDINSETLTYDAEEVQKDIETYGLYTYADFEDLITEDAFELYNAAYLKIAVGKGYITWDDVLDLIDIYFDVGVVPLDE